MFGGKDRVFIIENGKLHRSNDLTFENFTMLIEGIDVPNKYLTCYPVRCGNGFYFILDDKKIYRFSLENFKVSVVRSMNPV